MVNVERLTLKLISSLVGDEKSIFDLVTKKVFSQFQQP